MGTLGSYLREARETRGLDLREAAQQTRISIAYLKAIEEEDFRKLPGEVFVRGFLKSYAKYLLLPEDEVMKRYGELKAPPAGGKPETASPSVAHEERGKRPVSEALHGVEPLGARVGKQNLEPLMWSGVAIIAIAAIILMFLPGKRVGEQRVTPVATMETATAAVSAPVSTEAAPNKLFLEIDALEDTWVLVRTDASPQKHAVLKKGESITWSADHRFLLSYGKVGAAILRLNGKELAVAGPKDAAVRDLVITAAGIALQKLEPERPRTSHAVAPKSATSTSQSSTSAPVRLTTPQAEHTAPSQTTQQIGHTAPAPTHSVGTPAGTPAGPPPTAPPAQE